MIPALWFAAAFGSTVSTADLDGAVLSRSTLLQVDILDHTSETIAWTGSGSVLAFDPNGVFAGIIASGTSLVPTVSGTYTLSLVNDEPSWEVEVTNALGGRVWSETWSVETGGFSAGDAVDVTFFAHLTANGGDATVELRGVGLAGTIVAFSATELGVPGTFGRSAPDTGQALTDVWPLYLQPPETAVGVSPFTALIDPAYTSSEEACDNLDDEGSFSFLTTVDGVWHVVCDTSLDGVLDMTDPADLHLQGQSSIGFNLVEWDGRLADGQRVPAALYDCQITVAPMEVHAILGDVETGFEGLRLFRSDPSTTPSSLPMFWDDSLVAAQGLSLPSGQQPLDASGPFGLPSGDATLPPVAHGNSRAWGAFTAFGKGDRAFLDTWTWIDPVSSPVFTIEVTDPADVDLDGLSDLREQCELCTDPYDPDTDGDGLLDGLEQDTLRIDPCNVDTDADEVPDGVEVPDPNNPRDTDGDGQIDADDPDDDNDNVPTADEDYDDDDDPTNNDTDGDGTPDYRDIDDDGDGLLTNPTEDVNDNGDPRDDDTDGDGTPDYLDPDRPEETAETGDTGTITLHTGLHTGLATADTDVVTPTGLATALTGDTGTVIILPTAGTADTDDTSSPPLTALTGDTALPTGATATTGDTAAPTGVTGVTGQTATTGHTGATADTGTVIVTTPTGSNTGHTGTTTPDPLVPVVDQYYEGGCSCDARGGAAGAWALVFVALGLARRRRR